MKKQNENLTDAALLRQKAEEQLQRQQSKTSLLTSENDMLKLIYELEVHQIELEMQNEELVIAKEKAQQAKEKAQLAEEKYTELYDFAPSGYFSLSKDGKIKELNFVAAQMLGKERLHMITRQFAFFVSVNTRPVFNLFFDKVFTSKTKQTCEVIISTEGNLPIYVNIDGIVSQNNEVCLLTLIDITERKTAENKIKEIAINWQTTFDAIDDLILLLSPNHDIIEINKAGLTFINKSREEVVGKKCFTLIHNANSSIINCPCDISFKEKRVIVNESTQDNRTYELIAWPVFDQDNNVQAFTHIIKDITDRKNTEIDLINAKEKAEESEKLKTAFLQNMSHEIRTPMNAICGFSKMLNKPELSDEKRKSFVSIIVNSSNQLLSIVTDILTISSLETKQEKVNIKALCINNLIVDFLAIFKTQAFNQNISLYAKQQLTDRQSEIYTDITKITQILTNLLTNALKFTHEGFIEFGYNLKNEYLEFYVKDSGIGIKTEMQEKIFERFRQANENINMKYGGSGLGLAISKAFTELLGGKIWVQSELDKGSTFYFTIPYKPVHEIDKTNSPTVQNENFPTVLVAEDEECNFLLIEELLSDMDLKLIHAKDGQETVDICRTNPKIDLVLMDIKMPIMNGHEAAKLIKDIRPDLIIIAQSAYGLEQEIEKYSGVFDDYLTKPIDEDDLKQKLVKYIANFKAI